MYLCTHLSGILNLADCGLCEGCLLADNSSGQLFEAVVCSIRLIVQVSDCVVVLSQHLSVFVCLCICVLTQKNKRTFKSRL